MKVTADEISQFSIFHTYFGLNSKVSIKTINIKIKISAHGRRKIKMRNFVSGYFHTSNPSHTGGMVLTKKFTKPYKFSPRSGTGKPCGV